jgi:hypothetical protein
MRDFEWNKLSAVQTRLKPIIYAIVERHRTRGDVLTWRLIHEIEDEALTTLIQMGDLDEIYVGMMRTPPIGLPKTEDPVDFKGSNAIPAALAMIHDAYRHAH